MDCKQKYCRYCQKPFLYGLDGTWLSGRCKVARYVALTPLKKGETKKYETQIFFCNCYSPRRRKIDY